jgi:DNA topoisomerase I
MALTTIKLRDRLFFHIHDFEPAHAPKGSSKGGQFVSKGGGGGGTTSKAKPAARTPQTKPSRGTRKEGFEPLERAEKSFTLPGGGKLPSHIANLKIPPAWQNVRYNPEPKGDLLVSGSDAKGRPVAMYSERFMQSQAAAKFKRIERLAPKFNSIMEKNKNLQNSKDPSTRDLASALSLIMHTGIRPGSETDTGAEKQAYGATTLKGEHVTTDKDGNTVLQFVGKKGKDLSIPVTDPAIAKDLQQRAKQSGPDQQIFPNAHSRHLLSHVQKLAGASFKTKDFRTLLGTKIAAAEVANMPVPKSAAEYKKYATAVAKKVSETLGNTPAIALASYIAPSVFADWKLAANAST